MSKEADLLKEVDAILLRDEKVSDLTIDRGKEVLAFIKKYYRQKIKKAKAQGRKEGIRLAINNLTKHYCIRPEAHIKEIEEESNG